MKTKTFSNVHYLFIIVLVLVVSTNAAAPYVGLKWEYSLTMFSSMETDCSNHLLFPTSNIAGNYEYYLVENIEIDESKVDSPHVELLLDLLATVGHPVAEEFGLKREMEEAPKPIHGDMIRYHLYLFGNEGVNARIIAKNHVTGEEIEFSTQNMEASPDYSLWSAYPMVLHNYTEIHEVVRRYNSRERESG